MSSEFKHKLVAVISANILGNTTTGPESESNVLGKVTIFRKILHDVIGVHNGEAQAFFGDGVVCTLGSSAQAVQCAIEIQKQFIAQNVPVSIGVHYGEAGKQYVSLFGPGVEMTHKIVRLGVAGSVVISEQISEELKIPRGIPNRTSSCGERAPGAKMFVRSRWWAPA